MRIPRLLVVVLAAIGLVAIPATAAQAAPPIYYLALGDSLAAGFQPGGDTTAGYVYDVYNHLHATHPNLVLINLGCDGETTTSMVSGGCSGTPVTPYTTGSQLGDAVKYLQLYGSAVKYLTIDIGANDVDGCLPGGVPNAACLLQGAQTITTNLNTIMATLKRAAGGKLPQHSAGMTYYDPFLQQWLTGPEGELVAAATVPLAAGVNLDESTIYTGYGAKIADVFTTFKTLSFAPTHNTPPYGKLPVNVARICTWTWMCSQQNIHANDTGYLQIAKTFEARL
jgi:lysophospholipase L1-like esterase